MLTKLIVNYHATIGNLIQRPYPSLSYEDDIVSVLAGIIHHLIRSARHRKWKQLYTLHIRIVGASRQQYDSEIEECYPKVSAL